MSDSESDCDSENYGTPLRNLVNVALSMKPTMVGCSSIRKNLLESLDDSKKSHANSPNSAPLPPITRNKKMLANQRQDVQDSFNDLAEDIKKVHGKLDTLVQNLLDIIDHVDSLERRIDAIDSRVSQISQARSDPPSFADAVSRNIVNSSTNNDRISKLEYTSSEEERKKRLLQITIKHPQLNASSTELSDHVKYFFTSKLGMTLREVDVNLTATKAPKDNKIIVSLTHRRFKIFIFKARRKLHLEDEDATKELYINDNLTTLNFGLLMKLKRERTRRNNENIQSFDVVYTFNGRVYVKIQRNDTNDNALYIKNCNDYDSLLKRLTPPQSSPQHSQHA